MNRKKLNLRLIRLNYDVNAKKLLEAQEQEKVKFFQDIEKKGMQYSGAAYSATINLLIKQNEARTNIWLESIFNTVLPNTEFDPAFEKEILLAIENFLDQGIGDAKILIEAGLSQKQFTKTARSAILNRLKHESLQIKSYFRKKATLEIINLKSGITETMVKDFRAVYVEISRIEELKKLSSSKFNLTKLIRLCEELNECYDRECYFALIMLTRAIIDHVPPIFGLKSFSQVCSSYKGSKSFIDSMEHLSESSRKIADGHLHTQIRKKEILPNFTQVNFSNDFDVLLAEIVRLLK